MFWLPVVLLESASAPMAVLFEAGPIGKESVRSVCRVAVAFGVLKQRLPADSRVVQAGFISPERISTNGRVLIAGRIVT